MKITILYLLIIFELHANTIDNNITIDCDEIKKEIDLLKQEKLINTSTKVATYFLGGGYIYGITNKEIDARIRVLKMKLSSCENKRLN